MDINGTPIGGLIGTIRSIKFMIRETNPYRVFFVWDASGGSAKRRSIFKEYKAGRKVRLNRSFDEDSVDVARQNMDWQMSKTKEFLKVLGVTQIEVGDIEADDVIGYLCGYFESTPKVIVSTDRDMWQLVNDRTAVYWPTKQKYITSSTFKDYTSCPPYNYTLMRAMEGSADSSDNIKGIKGLGEKTILKVFGTMMELPINLDQLIELVEHQLSLDKSGLKKLKNTEKRWMQALLDERDTVRRNMDLMQLTSPIISAASASIIRSCIASKPTFKFTNLKLALMNHGIQLTDQDLISTFKSYQMRWEAHETQ